MRNLDCEYQFHGPNLCSNKRVNDSFDYVYVHDYDYRFAEHKATVSLGVY